MSGGAYCPVIIPAGTLTLGIYDFDTQPGYCVIDVQVGWPEVRTVERGIALGDGTIDETYYYGARPITVTFRLDQRYERLQALLDRLLPLVSIKQGEQLGLALPGQTQPTDFRYLNVRGVDAPLVIDGPKYRTISLSFKSYGRPYWYGATECVTILPSDPGPEAGRVYDLTFDRVYPAGVLPNSATFTNPGNAPTDWTLALNGAAVDPEITVNGSTIKFNRNGGVSLSDTNVIYIDTLDRTITDDAGNSLYSQTNFDEWTWTDMLLQPGSNTVSISGTGFDIASQLLLCYAPMWY